MRYVDLYASGGGVDRFVAERDVVLTYVLKIMKEDGIIQDLAFKGGTCIRKIYLGKVQRMLELIGVNRLPVILSISTNGMLALSSLK